MATKVKFTDTFIQKLELPEAGKREFYQDTQEPNLYLKVTSAGKVLLMRFKFLIASLLVFVIGTLAADPRPDWTSYVTLAGLASVMLVQLSAAFGVSVGAASIAAWMVRSRIMNTEVPAAKARSMERLFGHPAFAPIAPDTVFVAKKVRAL